VIVVSHCTRYTYTDSLIKKEEKVNKILIMIINFYTRIFVNLGKKQKLPEK
jgi:hypothetical protein